MKRKFPARFGGGATVPHRWLGSRVLPGLFDKQVKHGTDLRETVQVIPCPVRTLDISPVIINIHKTFDVK